jgi:predicted transcriptional regulator
VDDEMLKSTALIVTAFVSNSHCGASDLPDLIRVVQSALAGTSEPEPPAKQEPAVSIRSSIKADGIVCLEDGKSFKSLKRHLRTDHGLDPASYREKWGLKRDYPMVAPNYSAARSAMAKSMGLGQGGRQAVAAATPAPAPSSTPARRPRAKRSTKTSAPT